MAFRPRDVERFVGQWVVLQLSTGSVEGQMVSVTRTAVRLQPVLALVKGAIIIDDFSVVTALGQVYAVRGCSRVVAEEAVADMQKMVSEAKAAEAAPPPASAPAKWGNWL